MIHFRFIRSQKNRKFRFSFAVKRFCKNQCIVETQYYPKEIKIQLINLNVIEFKLKKEKPGTSQLRLSHKNY